MLCWVFSFKLNIDSVVSSMYCYICVIMSLKDLSKNLVNLGRKCNFNKLEVSACFVIKTMCS